MKGKIGYLGLLVLAFAFLAASCATTTLTLVWKDTSFSGRIDKIVVVGTFKSPTVRNVFEDEFVRQLRARGADVVASYPTVPGTDLPKKQALMAKIRESGADAVLVTRLVDKKTVERYVPGRVTAIPFYYRRWGLYFDYIYTPGYTVEERYSYAETNVYLTSNEQLVWSARSRTLVSGDRVDDIKSFVKTMVKKMAKDKLVG
jgi:hypothetical protein